MYRLKKLPYKKDYMTTDIYKYLSDANYSLGALKGYLDSSPHINVILRLIILSESKSSCDIENIKTSFEDVFINSISYRKNMKNTDYVINHMRAINILYRDIIKRNKLISKDIHNIQKLVAPNSVGIRTLRGHKIYNKVTNTVLYTPPQDKDAIMTFYENLLDFINNKHEKYDPLIKMAIAHYQFECIHPYINGNGRVGRIINSMCLIQSKRLNYPILNLSTYLNNTKEIYFHLLEKCHNNINYLDEFVIHILKGINETTKYTLSFIEQINRIMKNTEKEIKKKLPKIYSLNLLTHIFKFPYTKIELLRGELSLSRTTAAKYLKLLEINGFVTSQRNGKETIYKNIQFADLFNSITQL